MRYRLAAFAALIVTSALGGCGPGGALPDSPQSASSADTITAPPPEVTFLNRAAMFETFEIQAAAMAQTQAERQDVKDYAAAEIAAHRQALRELTDLAAAAHMAAPVVDLDDNYDAYLAMLHRTDGAAFDSIYASQQALAYTNAAGAYAAFAAGAPDSPLKTWAARRAPVLQQGVAAARTLGSGG